MSFKREGNDSGLLKNLQHRRVSEILGDFIPEDEALLLSNGRLTCTVCPKRPIFDTIQMLSLHRKGKNHLYELSKCLQHKRDSEYKKRKQMQRQMLKTGQLSVPLTETKDCSSLSFIAHSLNRSKKTMNKFRPGRKFVLDISEGCGMKSNASAPVVLERSANSQVRFYLKSLSRKRPLEKAINKMRSNYGGRQMQYREKTEGKCEDKSGGGLSRHHHHQHHPPQDGSSKTKEARLKMFESGWIQDPEGKWVKDPNVEFDSDEEEPQTV